MTQQPHNILTKIIILSLLNKSFPHLRPLFSYKDTWKTDQKTHTHSHSHSTALAHNEVNYMPQWSKALS